MKKTKFSIRVKIIKFHNINVDDNVVKKKKRKESTCKEDDTPSRFPFFF